MAQVRRNKNIYAVKLVVALFIWSINQPSEWRVEKPLKRENQILLMATIFWDTNGVIGMDLLKKKEERSLDNITVRVSGHLTKKKVLFHHDNTSALSFGLVAANCMNCVMNC
ncbi:uncharacterized protein LOC129242869 [Anastrepha obliqua]|uniref:uncharacterized protein LOC129242869 n=1 Tax=Anastrepha obliqua TaxID=95512 RepID=UPI002409A259|nr:uncharacterized protein LOC129242869 [Anastrepha obliqua]